MKKIISIITAVVITAAMSMTVSATQIPNEVEVADGFTFKFCSCSGENVMRILAPAGGVGDRANPMIDAMGFYRLSITGAGRVYNPKCAKERLGWDIAPGTRVNNGTYIGSTALPGIIHGYDEVSRFDVQEGAVGVWTVKGVMHVTYGYDIENEVIGKKFDLDFQISNQNLGECDCKYIPETPDPDPDYDNNYDNNDRVPSLSPDYDYVGLEVYCVCRWCRDCDGCFRYNCSCDYGDDCFPCECIDEGDQNPAAGVPLAVIPTLITAAAVAFSKKPTK